MIDTHGEHTRDNLPVETLHCARCGAPNGPRVQYGAKHVISISFRGVEPGWTLTDYTPGGKFTAYCGKRHTEIETERIEDMDSFAETVVFHFQKTGYAIEFARDGYAADAYDTRELDDFLEGLNEAGGRVIKKHVVIHPDSGIVIMVDYFAQCNDEEDGA